MQIKSTAKILLTTLLASAPLISNADIPACNKYNTSYDKTYCASKMFFESDNELNKVYKQLNKYIDKKTANNLKLVQREWIKYRNAKCESTPGTIMMDCSYYVNTERAEYLRKRVIECKSGACDNDAIAIRNW